MTATTSQDASRTSHRSTDGDHSTLADRAFHLIGIGGAGMSVVAQLLAARGAYCRLYESQFTGAIEAG